jgi:hypothetical protein
MLAYLGMRDLAQAQSLDDLNLQIHGFATQSLIYTAANNWNTTNSSDGSPAWTEAVVNMTAQPTSRIRVGVQARYFLLGTLGNTITLDWAMADIKLNEHFGIRAGKVKTPTGLLNEAQDVDPAQLWILLPQSVYPIATRNATLSHNGGVVYGAASLGKKLGKLDYRGYGGQRQLASDDGDFQPLRDEGIAVSNGTTGPTFGVSGRWHPPLAGLMLGASEASEQATGALSTTYLSGTLQSAHFYHPYIFGQFERGKVMVAGEYSRVAARATLNFTGLPAIHTREDWREFYVMSSYKLSNKLAAGVYYSSNNDHAQVASAAKFQKDWALSARYDFDPFVYLKLEEHLMDGTMIGFSTLNNTGGLVPDTRMTMLKLGVSF